VRPDHLPRREAANFHVARRQAGAQRRAATLNARSVSSPLPSALPSREETLSEESQVEGDELSMRATRLENLAT
jgi:hypothetical protein